MAQAATGPLPLPIESSILSPPGDTLADLLEEHHMSQLEVASRCGVSVKLINEVITATAPLSATLAIALEQVFKVPAKLWMRLEANYRAELAKEASRLTDYEARNWVQHFAYNFFANLGFLPVETGRNAETYQRKAEALLDFFQLSSPKEWEGVWLNPKVAFRRSLTGLKKPFDTSFWLRAGEREAKQFKCAPYHRAAFLRAFATVREAALHEDIRQAVHDLQSAFAKTGVALVVLPAPPGIGVSGATHWRHNDLAILQLSLLYKRDDSFFFTLAHEAAHILLHGKRDVFLEGVNDNDEQKEAEANKWAANFWVPTKKRQAFERRGDTSEASVRAFAKTLSVPAGIVVGQLQHSGFLQHTHLNHLKRKLVITIN